MMSEVSLARAVAPESSPAALRLVKATQEFESILLASWLERVEESYAGSDNDTDPAHGTLASMGAEAMASALAARGGIGISKMLLRQLAKPEAGSELRLTNTTTRGEAGHSDREVKASLDFSR